MARLCLLVLPALWACSDAAGSMYNTCGDIKAAFQKEDCCGQRNKDVKVQIRPNPMRSSNKFQKITNKCADVKKKYATLDNAACFDAAADALEQSGADISETFTGGKDAGNRIPITKPYYQTALCPVNVHWHLGAEHRSEGQFDESASSTRISGASPGDKYKLKGGDKEVRYGLACKKFNANDAKFTTEYQWKYCTDMRVGETYEVHWPHSSLGACGTPNQYQSPFYDGVFCHFKDGPLKGKLPEDPQVIADNVGVQGQVFTIINDEEYYYPDLIRGMIVDKKLGMGQHVTAYTGSTTGTTRNNHMCSSYSPITWQVDRKCHLISASTFDKMCADMLQMHDDMSGDVHPHGAREVVWKNLTANNQNHLWMSNIHLR